MTRFAQGTNPEYIKKVNNALYGEGHEASLEGDETVREELLEEAEAIGPGDNIITGDTTGISDTTTPTPTTAGYMGIPKIAWVAIIGVGVYYAYSKGMLDKILK